MGYTVATMKELIAQGAEIHTVHWDVKKVTPYRIPKIDGLYTYPRSHYGYKSLLSLIERICPEIIVVSGWQDSLYVSVLEIMRKQNKFVVAAIDAQWKGSYKNLIGLFAGRLGLLRRLYSHVWVPGYLQYEFARRIGFSKENIIYDMYSADLDMFQRSYEMNLFKKAQKYPHRFLFVGRLEEIKGLKTLISAWDLLTNERNDWELKIIGNGSLYDDLKNKKNIILSDFMQPEDLINEIGSAGCFILPSILEPWGVVVHEFCAGGLPVILSNKVGSAPSFLISGMNGYMFSEGDHYDLYSKMKLFIDRSDDEMILMSKFSNDLSKKITPKTSAYNLLSISNPDYALKTRKSSEKSEKS